MAETFYLIETYTVPNGGVNTITFSNIPQTYTDLMILGSLKTSRNADNDFIKGYFNSDTTDGNYAGFINYNGGGTIAGGTQSALGAPRYFGDVPANAGSNTANWFSSTRIWIHGYTDSYVKPYGSESGQNSNNTAQLLTYGSGRWNGTAPITSVSFTCGVTGPWLQHSTLSLYGIKGSN